VWVALLRGVNVSGRNRVPMKDLKAIAESLGHTDAETYLQSGNVVFSTATRNASDVVEGLRAGLKTRLDVDVPVLLRSAKDLQKILQDSPFTSDEPDPKKVHATFLETAPTGDGGEPSPRAGRDEFRLIGREIHLHTPDGYGNSVYMNPFWEKRFGVAATTRNWRSVTALLAMAESREN
jgi:uncharacterized protein (DUF1697 family)